MWKKIQAWLKDQFSYVPTREETYKFLVLLVDGEKIQFSKTFTTIKGYEWDELPITQAQELRNGIAKDGLVHNNKAYPSSQIRYVTFS
jgi:hypothetical protein